MSKYQPFRPSLNSYCLCGSGLPYKKCCKGNLPGTAKISTGWREHAKKNRWLRAIKSLRTDVTQYSIWHLSHTAPAIAINPALRPHGLMQIDIAALSDHVGTLMMAYAEHNILHRADAVLDRLAQNINDPRWRRKIAYHKGICALWREDREKAKKEISVLGKVTPNEEDEEILQIYLDLNGSDMGLTERLKFTDRIIELTPSSVDKLQYLGGKAVQLLLSKDFQEASICLDTAISFGRHLEQDGKLSFRAEVWLCKALELHGILSEDDASFDEIISRMKTVLAGACGLSDIGQSMVYRSLGDAQRYCGKFKDAFVSYATANVLNPEEVLITFQAECALRQGKKEDALKLIRSVDPTKMDRPELSDYVTVLPYIANANGDIELLKAAQKHLKELDGLEPYFETQRFQHIVFVQEAIDKFGELRTSEKQSFWRSINRAIQLQPNFFGVGINFNNMIEDAIDRAEEKKRQGLPEE